MVDIPTLAKDLHKETPTVEIKGEKISIDREGATLLRNISIHIIRNAMDHGIEAANERKKLGKSAFGKIEMNFEVIDKGLLVRFTDDGGGLDLEKIRQASVKRAN